MNRAVKRKLDSWYIQYNKAAFIENDPVLIPHRFSKKEDQEISAFFAATFAWGQRKTIIQKTMELMELMDHAPHQFILQHKDSDLKKLLHFKHRTYQATDTFYFIDFLHRHYSEHASLENAFSDFMKKKDADVSNGLIGFENYFFNVDYAPQRTRKHVATPQRNSSCKRLNMFLRWMVRKDEHGVDLGLWKKIKASQLLCPLDVHVGRIARELGLLNRDKDDWQSVLELTAALREFDPADPVKYDYALFGRGVTGDE